MIGARLSSAETSRKAYKETMILAGLCRPVPITVCVDAFVALLEANFTIEMHRQELKNDVSFLLKLYERLIHPAGLDGEAVSRLFFYARNYFSKIHALSGELLGKKINEITNKMKEKNESKFKNNKISKKTYEDRKFHIPIAAEVFSDGKIVISKSTISRLFISIVLLAAKIADEENIYNKDAISINYAKLSGRLSIPPAAQLNVLERIAFEIMDGKFYYSKRDLFAIYEEHFLSSFLNKLPDLVFYSFEWRHSHSKLAWCVVHEYEIQSIDNNADISSCRQRLVALVKAINQLGEEVAERDVLQNEFLTVHTEFKALERQYYSEMYNKKRESSVRLFAWTPQDAVIPAKAGIHPSG